MNALFSAVAYASGAYGVWALIDALDDDPSDPAPLQARWLLPLLWPVMLPALGVGLLIANLADRAKARRG